MSQKVIKATASIIIVGGKIYTAFITPVVNKQLGDNPDEIKLAKRRKNSDTGETYYSALAKMEVTNYLNDPNYRRKEIIEALKTLIENLSGIQFPPGN